MAKVSGVINAAAHGLVTATCHSHWHEVNPIKRQSVDREAWQKKDRELTEKIRQEERRRRLLRANGSVILPDQTKGNWK